VDSFFFVSGAGVPSALVAAFAGSASVGVEFVDADSGMGGGASVEPGVAVAGSADAPAAVVAVSPGVIVATMPVVAPLLLPLPSVE